MVTICCSNNPSPTVWSVHVNFWYPDTIWGPLVPIFCFNICLFPSSVLFIVGIVMHALSYFSFLFFLLLNVFGISFANVWVFVYTVCARFVFDALYSRSHDYSAHWASAVLPDVQRQKNWCIFSMLWNLSPVVSSSKTWLFLQYLSVYLIQTWFRAQPKTKKPSFLKTFQNVLYSWIRSRNISD